MKRPTRKNTINLRITTTGYNKTIYENIVGVFDYPVVIHRRVCEHEEIQEGRRKRHTSDWVVSHIPTGLSFGFVGKWQSIHGFATEIKDHSTLLMHTEKQMMNHPQFEELIELRDKLKAKWAL